MAVLFLQSDIEDPHKMYAEMMGEGPVFWDAENNCWAICSYENCRAILADPDTRIPQPAGGGENGLNEYALVIAGRLARLSNPPRHLYYRQAAMQLWEKMKIFPLEAIMDKLIPGPGDGAGTEGARWAAENACSGGGAVIDWSAVVGKKLPVAAILHGFGFSEEDTDLIISKMPLLVGIMLPHKTAGQVASINEAAEKIYRITEKTIGSNGLLQEMAGSLPVDPVQGEEIISRNEMVLIYISNLIGLMIQSYDACRGVLCNSLLQVLVHGSTQGMDRELPFRDIYYREASAGKSFFYKSVVESLRFDPPVHHTRRIAVNDIFIDGKTIVKGQAILIVLAAANRDPEKFGNPGRYDIHRINNEDHITFGSGAHACLARQFATGLATEALAWLFRRFPKTKLIRNEVKYEPLVNARIPRELFISLGV